jgi:phosphocarrier protein
MIEVLTLAAEQGTELVLKATGPDAEEAVAALADLLSRGDDGEEDA